jgi:hypothetical protein
MNSHLHGKIIRTLEGVILCAFLSKNENHPTTKTIA